MKLSWFLLILTGVSFFLRWVQSSTSYTLPMGDEFHLVGEALNMMVKGNLKELAFPYGDVCKIPYLFMDCIYFLFALWKGLFNSVSSVFPDETFYNLNRLWNVTAGSAAIVVGYYLGNKIYSNKAGIVLAILLFVNPLQFKYSLYAKPDDTAFLFHLLSIYFALDIGSPDTRLNKRGYILSAVFIALSMGAKVNHFCAALFPLFMHLFNPNENLFKKIFSANLLLFFLTMIGAYFLVTPTAIINFSNFCATWFGWFFPDAPSAEYKQHFSFSKIGSVYHEVQKMVSAPILFSLWILGVFELIRSQRNAVLLMAGLSLFLFFGVVVVNSVNFFLDPHLLFPLLPYVLVFIAGGIMFLGKLLSLLKRSISPVMFSIVIAGVLSCEPFFKSIVNFETDYTYMGGDNKESFINFIYGVPQSIALPLFPISEEESHVFEKVITKKGPIFEDGSFEKENLAEWIHSSSIQLTAQDFHSGKKSLILEGPFSQIVKVIPANKKDQIESLRFWIKPISSSNLLRSALNLEVVALKNLNKVKMAIHKNQYHLFLRGNWNWREIDIRIPQEPQIGSWTFMDIPIRKNLEQDGVQWKDIDSLLLKINLNSPYKTLFCYIDDMGQQ